MLHRDKAAACTRHCFVSGPSMPIKANLRRSLIAAALLCAGAAGAALPLAEGSFASVTAAAMDRMMAGMAVNPSGDVDRDFVAMMTPHHQGAIDMAVAELRYGRDERLKRIAQEIIVEQQQEIAAMKLALGDPLPPSAPVPTQAGHKHSMNMEHMK